jgi:hypothetical protein
MNSTDVAQQIADDIGTLGMSFYFDGGTNTRAQELGMDVVSFYFAGRGGVLGDASPNEVDEIFCFFKPGLVAGMYAHSQTLTARAAGVTEHLGAARAFANRTFGAVPPVVLEDFHAAAQKVINAAPEGRWPIFDGYRREDLSGTLVERCYLDTILLRELRGGVHTDAVHAAGLTPLLACYLDRDGAYFKLHGFSDEDVPTVTDADRAARTTVEADTTARSAALFAGLSDEERTAIATATAALAAALKAPVPVA